MQFVRHERQVHISFVRHRFRVYVNSRSWPLSDGVLGRFSCKISYVVRDVCKFSSIFTLALLSVDRCLASYHHLAPLRTVAVGKTAIGQRQSSDIQDFVVLWLSTGPRTRSQHWVDSTFMSTTSVPPASRAKKKLRVRPLSLRCKSLCIGLQQPQIHLCNISG